MRTSMRQAAVLTRALACIAAIALSCASANAEPPRTVAPLERGWRFMLGDPTGAEASDFADASWTALNLPHTWNGADGEDGGGYHRGSGWYRIRFRAPDTERTWIEFDGAALAADVWVNGRRIGRHEGGYARFRFDITDALIDGETTLAVRVDNSANAAIAPLGGDFTVFGGLYRPVRLIGVNALHIDLADHGGPGVAMTASNVTAAAADLRFEARVRNTREDASRVRVRFTLIDASGRAVLSREASLSAPAGAVREVSQRARLAAPHIWNGRADPYLYTFVTELFAANGALLDRVSLRTGVRDARFDADQGFILNGRPLPLYGVNYFHAGRPGRGLAVSDAEIDQDMQILFEQGGTGARFVHFQHPQRAYDMADALGLAVWTEIPLNAAANADPAFRANLAQQMRELIRQNRHHPSVVIWGLGNEVYAADAPAQAAVALAQRIAHEEDPTRATAYAHCCQDDLHPLARIADLAGYNRYYGWYDNEFARIASWADERRARAPRRPFGVSEFGAGASILHQQSPPERPRPDGPWHPEQYQTAFHEAYWRALRERRYLWGAFVWVGFDLASDGRNEGDRPGINDKGLVTYDRAVRKDAWYWYQANWTDAPMAHILDRRLTTRDEPIIAVRAYTTLPRLSLRVNGVEAGAAEVVDHVAQWSEIRLTPGHNRVEALADGQVLDTVFWTLQ